MNESAARKLHRQVVYSAVEEYRVDAILDTACRAFEAIALSNCSSFWVVSATRLADSAQRMSNRQRRWAFRRKRALGRRACVYWNHFSEINVNHVRYQGQVWRAYGAMTTEKASTASKGTAGE